MLVQNRFFANSVYFDYNQDELKALIEREHKKIDEANKKPDSTTESKPASESKVTEPQAAKGDAAEPTTVTDTKAPNAKY